MKQTRMRSVEKHPVVNTSLRVNEYQQINFRFSSFFKTQIPQIQGKPSPIKFSSQPEMSIQNLNSVGIILSHNFLLLLGAYASIGKHLVLFLGL